MAGFQYYIPGGDAVFRPTLEALGLWEIAFDDASYDRRGVTTGPDSQPGTILTVHHKDDPATGYFPDAQTWRKADDAEYWLGWYNAAPPQPADLERSQQLAGHSIRLGDGNDWLVPVARSFPYGISLPQSLSLGAGGNIAAAIIPRYAAFGEKAAQLWDVFIAECEAADSDAETQQTMPAVERMQLAIEALAFNYRIGRHECNALGLLTTDNLSEVLGAVIDQPTIIEHMRADAKKNDCPDCDTSTISAGAGA